MGSGIAGGVLGLGLRRLARAYPRGRVLAWALVLNPTFWLGVAMAARGVWTELTRDAEGFGVATAWAAAVVLVLGVLTLTLSLALPLELAWAPTALWGALFPTLGDLAGGVHSLPGALVALALGGWGSGGSGVPCPTPDPKGSAQILPCGWIESRNQDKIRSDPFRSSCTLAR